MIQLKIEDNSGSGKDLFVAIVGYQGDQWPVAGNERVWSYMDGSGQVHVCHSGQYFQDFFFRVNKAYTGTLPYFFSGRVSFSFGHPLSGAVIQSSTGIPTPSTTDINDPSWYVINDKVEFTNKLSPPTDITTLSVNTTMVDGFGVPFITTLSGDVAGVQIAGGISGTRHWAFQEFENMSSDFTAQITRNSDGEHVRVISPNTALGRAGSGQFGPIFPAHLLEGYIDKCWQYFEQPGNYFNVKLDAYQGFPLGTSTSGCIVNNQFTFVNPSGGPSFTIDKPNTTDLIQCGGNGVFNVDPTVNAAWDGNIKTAVAGAMNRGVATESGVCNSQNFYQTKPHNEYARVVHQVSIDGKSYAFPYDDACNLYSSDISDNEPKSLKIELQPWL